MGLVVVRPLSEEVEGHCNTKLQISQLKVAEHGMDWAGSSWPACMSKTRDMAIFFSDQSAQDRENLVDGAGSRLSAGLRRRRDAAIQNFRIISSR